MYEYLICKNTLIEQLSSKFDLKSYCISLNSQFIKEKSSLQLASGINNIAEFNPYYNKSLTYTTSSNTITFKSKIILDYKVLRQLGLSLIHENHLLKIANWFRTDRCLHSKKNLYNFSVKFMQFLTINEIETNLSNKKLKPILKITSDEGIRKALLGFRYEETIQLSEKTGAFIKKASSFDRKFNKYMSSEAKWVLNQIDKLKSLQNYFFNKFKNVTRFTFKLWLKRGKFGKDKIVGSKTTFIERYIDEEDNVIATKKFTKMKVKDFLTDKFKWKTSRIEVSTTNNFEFIGNIIKETCKMFGDYHFSEGIAKLATSGDQTSLKYLFNKQK